MKAGERNQRIELQPLTETNDGGSLKRTYKTVATVWAKIITQRASQEFESARINARQRIRIGMLYRDDVTDKWRIVWKGQSFSIYSIDRSMAQQGELWLTAEIYGAE